MDREQIIAELRTKILEGLNQAAIQFLETTKKNNEKIVISENGKIRIIEASQL